MLQTRNIFLIQRRWKGGKQRWSAMQRKKTVIDRALENFDDFYGSVYGLRWRNMRAALLTENKYVAMVNNFGDTEKTCSLLELDGAINMKSLVQLAKERLEINNIEIFNQQSHNGPNNTLEMAIRDQLNREKKSLYPSGEDVTPHLAYNKLSSKEKDSKISNDMASQNKSLEQAIEEDTKLDKQRIVDIDTGCGALHDFMPATKIKGMEDWIPESAHYAYYNTTTDFPLNIELETQFSFPENLCLYTYEMGNCSEFKAPRKCLTGVLSHFLMDGASILPPLLLDVRHGERVLDACAAPGGKSLLMLQTLHPDVVTCNDVQESRANRIRKIMQEYLFDFRERWEGKRCVISQMDARKIDNYGHFDKILVDVPCTTDRHSLHEHDNNIFKSTRIKERLRIPELQAEILTNCLRLLRPGGSLVYATCSLSPVQNDGVVHMAMQRAFNEHGITTTVKDLSVIVQLFADIYKFENPNGLKYGQMVLPYLPANFGPMYFSKITKNKRN